MKSKRVIELLAPAKNLECGIAAIQYGADAVYIGGPSFGARKAASNSLEDITQLVKYAHFFNAKVFMAINTILFDHELKDVEKQIWKAWEIGVDAIIIQDMGILEMNLPPIPFHASTQAHNYTLEKVNFLGKCGFERVVLARELSLPEIHKISDACKVELEAFIHGALCVSLSGQCYMSQSIGLRSANRGACAQPCRKKYTLTDANGKALFKDQHLLSLKDMNQSDNIERMIDAGITSLKIEGRLKDIDYVKNITSYYRQKIDKIVSEREDLTSLSIGRIQNDFTPDTAKSFSRSKTDYFLLGRNKEISSFDTPKSQGEYIGIVKEIRGHKFTLQTDKPIRNNDGLYFLNRKKESKGIKVNKVEGIWITPQSHNGLKKGDHIYRNYNHTFSLELKNSKTIRQIAIQIELIQKEDGFYWIVAKDSDHYTYEQILISHAEKAKKQEQAFENIKKQLAKCGGTQFYFTSIELKIEDIPFVPAKLINEARRKLLDKIYQYRSERKFTTNSQTITPKQNLYTTFVGSFQENISNKLAKKFYKRHGMLRIEDAFELKEPIGNKKVMTTKHCLKYEAGYCRKWDKNSKKDRLLEPCYLYDGNIKFRVEFHCKECLMHIFKE